MSGSTHRPEATRRGHPPIVDPPPQRRRPRGVIRPGRFAQAAACMFLAFAAPGISESSSLLNTLAAIHAEVKELGPRPGQDFTSWNFFIGARDDEDDDDTYKDRHVAIVIQNVAGLEKMTILVTRMEAVGGNPGVRNAGESKSLSCGIKDGIPSVLRSDFGEKEALPVAREILKAVRNKKKLLRS